MSKKLRVLLDTNVVLDVLLERQPWLTNATAIWKAVDEGLISATIAASTLTDIYYVATRAKSVALAKKAVALCLEAFEIGTVDRYVLERACLLPGLDFEDNVQIACAEVSRCDAIVTRDLTGFADSPIAVWSPEECWLKIDADTRPAAV